MYNSTHKTWDFVSFPFFVTVVALFVVVIYEVEVQKVQSLHIMEAWT